MKRKNFLLLFLIISIIKLHSQETYKFIGVLTLEDNTLLPYKIEFSEKGGIIKGFSITDMLGEHETKNMIEGLYNKKSKEFEFVEKSIIYTKSSIVQDDFCYINYKGTLKLENQKAVLRGNFIGLFNDGEKCIDGKIKLIGSEKLIKRVKKFNKIIKKSKKIDDATKSKVNPMKFLDDSVINRLKNNENTSVFWNSNTLKMDIYDAGKEDGDAISIFVNGKKVLNNYTITKKIRRVEFELDATKKNEIVIKSESMGEILPNTARIHLIDSDKEIKLNTFLYDNEDTKITVIKLK